MKYFKAFVFQAAWVEVLATEPREPSRPTSARFELDERMPGVLLGCFGVFAVTESFADVLGSRQFSGFYFGEALGGVVDGVGLNSYSVPDLRLLVVTGKYLEDDISVTDLGELVVSSEVFETLSAYDEFVRDHSRELSSDGSDLKIAELLKRDAGE